MACIDGVVENVNVENDHCEVVPGFKVRGNKVLSTDDKTVGFVEDGMAYKKVRDSPPIPIGLANVKDYDLF